MEIHVSNPCKVGQGIRAFTAYQVSVSPNETNVSRRYSEFVQLKKDLTERLQVDLPELPKKVLKKFKDQVVEQRRSQLEYFLNHCANCEEIAQDPEFRLFLGLEVAKENQQEEEEEKEKIETAIPDEEHNKQIESDPKNIPSSNTQERDSPEKNDDSASDSSPHFASPSWDHIEEQQIPQRKLKEISMVLESCTVPAQRFEIIKLAGSKNKFSCDQVIELIKKLDFSHERLSAFQELSKSLVDPQNIFRIPDYMREEGEKMQAFKLIEEKHNDEKSFQDQNDASVSSIHTNDDIQLSKYVSRPVAPENTFLNVTLDVMNHQQNVTESRKLMEAIEKYFFTCHQLKHLIQILDVLPQRVEIYSLICPKIVDPQNAMDVIRMLRSDVERDAFKSHFPDQDL